jgi:3-oxoacyl-[acyl-carrier-protein] synthase II
VSRMNKRVVITGLGVISSIGHGWKDFWDSLLVGESGISPVTSFDTTNQFTHNGGEVHNFKPEQGNIKNQSPFLNRASEMALAATTLALEDSCLSNDDLTVNTVGVSFGTTFGAIQTIELINNLLLGNHEINSRLCYQLLTHSTPSAVAMENICSGPNFMFSTACAAGNYAIGYGFDMIRLGRAEIVLAGASDPFSRIAFTGFNQFSAVAPEKCQPFDKNRKGMMVAEGAGTLVLESLDSALRRNAPIYAEIGGYGLSCDAHHMTTASVDGITSCMKQAMKDSGISIDLVDYISAHGTGTAANDRMECLAIKELFGDRYKNIPVSSIKSMLGHTMGAASALEAIACSLAVKNNILPPTINFEIADPECDIDCVPNLARKHIVNIALNNSYAFGGNNASLVLRKYI